MKRLGWILFLMVFIGLKASAQSTANDTLKFSAHKKEVSIFLKMLTAANMPDPAKPVTIFAPEDKAFEKLPITDSLLKPSNQKALTGFINDLTIPGKLTVKDISRLIHQNNGQTVLTTISGRKYNAKINTNRNIELTDEYGSNYIIKVFDIQYKNAEFYIINAVIPAKK